MHRFAHAVLAVVTVLLVSGTSRALPDGVHPAIGQFFDYAGRSFSDDEIKRLKAVDVTGTARGSNITLFTAVANQAIHEVAPLVLARCGAPASASKVKALVLASGEPAAVALGSTLDDMESRIVGEMGGTKRPKDLVYKCSEAVPNVLQAIGQMLRDLAEAYQWSKQGKNADPDHGREAGAAMLWAVEALGDSGADRKLVMEHAETALRLIATTARAGAPQKGAVTGASPPKPAARK